ncbi:glucose-6-phosphate dehydrogenase assembly protein OpcA [Kineosporia sp. J2-2]|uniref:Glucose-6-phosphate dehydrogenase assembly protein OpcA n=1 Tax=Kineosporia corallincola TaxID=2835133 RepID=A0ABS5TCL3_9ACTN|nr:glucose-6-phosphate dehydrogenase assembly protein OpcA [Kineosporia corallincola]MBT0768822.1 glucose-6-phosphate dehydrogenase assembly protein OpcA [Kineosporia corallincola]
MIVDLPNTTTNEVSKRLVEARGESGAVAQGRVLTLILVADEANADDAIGTANDASREHPSRVLVIVRGATEGDSRLDAQIRVGGDAGAAEVVVLRLFGELANHGSALVTPLLLPDAPVVVWWAGEPPADPVTERIGTMATRRIVDSSKAADPVAALYQLASVAAPGTTDLSWSRLTRWRALLAAALDQPPYEEVTSATVKGAADKPSVELMAAWLAYALDCPVTIEHTEPGTGMVGVTLTRASGDISIVREDGTVATMTQPGQPERRVALHRRTDVDCLTEELRRLEEDELFADVLAQGMPKLREGASA